MSKIIVRRQEYANNGTHANEIESVVQENLIANTLSSATDIAASVGLVKTVNDSLTNLSGRLSSLTYRAKTTGSGKTCTLTFATTPTNDTNCFYFGRVGNNSGTVYDIGVLTFDGANVYIHSVFGREISASLSGNVVTITTPTSWATFSVISNNVFT